jgi:hypothetical protein
MAAAFLTVATAWATRWRAWGAGQRRQQGQRGWGKVRHTHTHTHTHTHFAAKRVDCHDCSADATPSAQQAGSRNLVCSGQHLLSPEPPA